MSAIPTAQTLRNTSLTLYAFHLRTDGSRGVEQVVPSASRLWERLVHLGNTLHISELQALKQELLCYRAGEYYPTAEEQLLPGQQSLLSNGAESLDFSVPAPIVGPDLSLTGFVSPFRVHDTYAIDLTLSPQAPITLGQLHQLNPQELLLPPHIQASLGQTLLLYAEVDGLQRQDRAIADACVAQFFPYPSTPEFVAAGKLLGSDIFEYDTLATATAQQRHILVWLNHYPLPSAVDALSERLFYLLLCRHKILYAYDQARWCHDSARTVYSDFERDIVQKFSQIAQSPDRLQQFKALLRTQLPQQSFQYAQYLRDLSDHATSIQTNLENYQNQMAKLALLPGNDLDFLQQFQHQTQTKYLKQIQVYREFLAPGQTLFQQLTDTIRGLVELEQAESDRRLEQTIQVVGVGLGVGAIFGSSSAFIDRPWMPAFSPNSALHPFVSSLLVSLLAALGAGFLTWLFTQSRKLPPSG